MRNNKGEMFHIRRKLLLLLDAAASDSSSSIGPKSEDGWKGRSKIEDRKSRIEGYKILMIRD